MPDTTVSRTAHLQTVIEFEMDLDPTTPRPLTARAARVRAVAAAVGGALALAVLATLGAGISTSSEPPAGDPVFEVQRMGSP